MKIAVVPFPGHTFEQMFSEWSPFFARNTVHSSMFMLREALKKRNIELISLEQMESTKCECDTILHFSSEQLVQKAVLERYSEKRHIYMAFEQSVVYPMHTIHGLKRLAEKVFDAIITPYHDVECANVYATVMPRDLPREQKNFNVETKPEKLACMFSGDKYGYGKQELYSERRRVIELFEKEYPTEFSLYGIRWGKPYSSFSVYQGPADDKMETSKSYRFVFTFENEKGRKGNVDEKIFDGMISGCVPVYYGVADITDFVPAECFVDYSRFGGPRECIEYLRAMPEDVFKSYQAAGRSYLADPKTREMLSAEDMAEKIDLAQKESVKKKHRQLNLLTVYYQMQRGYGKLCGLNRRLEAHAADRFLQR
jgi:hypothetical protein